MRKLLLGAALIAMVATSCKRDKDLIKATVRDTGDIAGGGCGYVLEISDEHRVVRPYNLPTAYQHDGFKVKVKFDTNGDGQLCSVYPDFEFIEVVQLTKVKTDLD
ncbi:MAG: hypothetical protein H6551_01865 [Chitinophagales bacterium]|nr:hypothetical protein [Chitinophagaceae bacterium]MCB9063870.1 hypothetical protein [Chitinophagales bacterium]